MKDILLVEDNGELAELIKTFLIKNGYSVHHAVRGEDAVRYLKKQKVRLLLLDIMLSEMDGFAVCRSVREQQNLPILIMSARFDKSDKLKGYELGADDYMEKPVDPDILTAKIRALLQRSDGSMEHSDMIQSGALTIHQDARKVYLDGKELSLNVKEYELLLLFVKNPGKTLQKEFIFGSIWGMYSSSENQTLTVHIKMLRTKIESRPREPKRIQTVWGVGYRYEEI